MASYIISGGTSDEEPAESMMSIIDSFQIPPQTEDRSLITYMGDPEIQAKSEMENIETEERILKVY